MSSISNRVKELLSEGGVSLLAERIIHFIYDTGIWPMLPRRTVQYNTVAVDAARLGDTYIPWHRTDWDSYEHGLVSAIRTHVKHGDSVVIVGGGWGVSSVIAADEAGEDGAVTTFEADKQVARRLKSTLDQNPTPASVTVCPVAVGNVVGGWAKKSDTEISDAVVKTISPDEIPDVDVLVLDCEGAEREILTEMTTPVETVIVETHGLFESPSSKIRDTLESKGYTVQSDEIAEPSMKENCIENDVRVLAATHPDVESSSSKDGTEDVEWLMR